MYHEPALRDSSPDVSTSSARVKFETERYRGAPVTDLDPFCTEFFDDPYSFYSELRAAGPVVWLSRYQCWAVNHHQEIVSILVNWKTFCSSRGVGHADFGKMKEYWRTPSLLLEADPPVHTDIRTFIGGGSLARSNQKAARPVHSGSGRDGREPA